MRTSWHDIWGSARGPATRLTPQTRLAAGAATAAACLISPVTTVPGALVAAASAVSWLVACRPPRRVLIAFVLLGLGTFLPYFLLAPLIQAGPPGTAWSLSRALEVPWSVLARGMSVMLVSIATVTSLSASDLREGLVRLPVPGAVSAILLQIVHQTVMLLVETRRVASAMAVRGASRGGLAAWRVLWSLPRVWFPRIIVRAERVAAAMEMRGYCDGGPSAFRDSRMGLADLAALVLVLGVLGLASALRWKGAS
jgi:energy-coupling factor transporter transmembrane protein EcfT